MERAVGRDPDPERSLGVVLGSADAAGLLGLWRSWAERIEPRIHIAVRHLISPFLKIDPTVLPLV